MNKMASRVTDRYMFRLSVRKVASDSLTKEFEKSVKGKKVKSPETGNDVLITSLKSQGGKSVKLYNKLYQEWADKNKKENPGDSEKKSISQKLNSFLGSIKGVSKKMAKSIKDLPENTQKFVSDPEYRSKQSKEAGKSIQKNAKKLAKSAWEGLKAESHATFIETPKIVATLAKEGRKPTKDEVKTLYGSAVYVAGMGLAAAPVTAGIFSAAGAAAGASAFAHSFSLHVGVKAMSFMFSDPKALADDGFLGYEAVESVAGVGSNVGLSSMKTMADSLPSSGALYDFSPFQLLKEVGSLVLASEKGDPEEKEAQGFMEALTGAVGKVVEEGFSEEDMKKIIQGKSF